MKKADTAIAPSQGPLGSMAGFEARAPRVRHLLRQPLTLVGAAFVLAIIVCGVFAPVLEPYSYSAGRLSDALQGPSRLHPLGTDWVGRDVLSRIIYGARSAAL